MFEFFSTAEHLEDSEQQQQQKKTIADVGSRPDSEV